MSQGGGVYVYDENHLCLTKIYEQKVHQKSLNQRLPAY